MQRVSCNKFHILYLFFIFSHPLCLYGQDNTPPCFGAPNCVKYVNSNCGMEWPNLQFEDMTKIMNGSLLCIFQYCAVVQGIYPIPPTHTLYTPHHIPIQYYAVVKGIKIPSGVFQVWQCHGPVILSSQTIIR